MKLKDVLTHFAAAIIIVLVVLGMMVMESDHEAKKEAFYPQVHVVNTEYHDVLDTLGIDKIEYYDWEETANALNCSPAKLSVEVFMDHLLGDPKYYNSYPK